MKTAHTHILAEYNLFALSQVT